LTALRGVHLNLLLSMDLFRVHIAVSVSNACRRAVRLETGTLLILWSCASDP
jgi:hypothetical protein